MESVWLSLIFLAYPPARLLIAAGFPAGNLESGQRLLKKNVVGNTIIYCCQYTGEYVSPSSGFILISYFMYL